MKRKYTWMILMLLVVALIVPVSAAAEVTMTSSQTELEWGDEVTVTVSISALDACKKGGIELSYDTDVFELVSGSWLLSNAFIQDFAVSTNDGVFAYTSATAVSGDIFQFTLKVKEGAAVGSSKVTVELALDGETLQESISLNIICNHSYGDWTEADKVNHKHTCSICGNEETAAHSWNADTVTKQPSCTEEGEEIYSCTVCGATKTDTVKKLDHTYDNACDTTCNSCGAVREIKHSYSTKWTADGTGHWHQCTVCGEKTDEAAHTPGDAATEWTAQKCTVCGYVLQSALGHTHNYSGTWTTDERGHWHECSGCEDPGDYADHSYDNDCDPGCNECGYIREVTHTYGTEWECDSTGHYHVCTLCGVQDEVIAHIPGTDATEDMDQVCTECGYVITPALNHTHTFNSAWVSDKTGHWQECDCGEKSTVYGHSWNQGTVSRAPTSTVAGLKTYTCTVCGAEKQEMIPILAEDTADSQLYVVFIAIGVVLVAAALFVIVGVIISRKNR